MPYQYRGSGPIWIATELGVQSIIAGECTFRDGAYPSGLMAEFQWWLLLVGLVAGGGLVAVVSMDSRRREQDIGELEQRAEATWIADQLSMRDRPVDPGTVENVLQVHREYLSLQPPDRLIIEDADDLESPGADALDRDPDREPGHEAGDRRPRPPGADRLRRVGGGGARPRRDATHCARPSRRRG
jgi:hypothetical protein